MNRYSLTSPGNRATLGARGAAAYRARGTEIMGESFQFLDIIFVAMVAAFIVLRLRSVLGRRTGHERPSPESVRGRDSVRDEKVISLPDRTDAEPEARGGAQVDFGDSPAAAGLTQIQIADPTFRLDQFIEGARSAYEMIVGAFAAGDTDALRPLLADDVYGNFDAAIEERQRRGQTLESTLVGIKRAEVVSAELEDGEARLTVRFESEIVSITKDGEGRIVEGDPHAVRQVTDLWTFSRDVRSSNPNWVLIATGSEA